MIENEISEFVKRKLVVEKDIILEYDRVKTITESVCEKERVSRKIRFEPDSFFKVLPKLTEKLEKKSPEERVYWFTGDYDDNGCYTAELKEILKNVALLFSIGADEVSIVSKELKSFISFETYDENGDYICEVKLHGKYEELYGDYTSET